MGGDWVWEWNCCLFWVLCSVCVSTKTPSNPHIPANKINNRECYKLHSAWLKGRIRYTDWREASGTDVASPVHWQMSTNRTAGSSMFLYCRVSIYLSPFCVFPLFLCVNGIDWKGKWQRICIKVALIGLPAGIWDTFSSHPSVWPCIFCWFNCSIPFNWKVLRLNVHVHLISHHINICLIDINN